ncbi:MAG: oxalate decarboxylase/phosphoglucose isomerase-like protein (cupin superfamily) [Alphaproteobacteria bacterium]|jgi:oxalate decarboxylase/phosphoglucose isomerase-like protein (cupin superfamily)
MILSLEDTKATKEAEFLRDPYLEWTAGEGVPVIEDFGIDILNAPTKPWARFGVDGAIAHLKGRGDFVSVFILDLPPGGEIAPQCHLFEEVIYVLDGHGSTTIETGDGGKHSFEWGPKSLFALPLNARYQHFNGSGSQRARLASTNNMCVMMKLFRNADFLFSNDYAFSDRVVSADYLTGGGEFIPAPRGRLMWETNFVPDLGAVELLDNPKRGKGSATLQFILGEGMMHAHESLMPVGTYKKAHRHGPDYHVLVVDGAGFSLFWHEGDADFVRVDWGDGWMFAPPDQMYHQHFNTGPEPARYMATAIGNSRYPFTERNQQNKLGVDVSVKDGGGQIEFEDQDPRIHAMFLDALKATSVTCRMPEFQA